MSQMFTFTTPEVQSEVKLFCRRGEKFSCRSNQEEQKSFIREHICVFIGRGMNTHTWTHTGTHTHTHQAAASETCWSPGLQWVLSDLWLAELCCSSSWWQLVAPTARPEQKMMKRKLKMKKKRAAARFSHVSASLRKQTVAAPTSSV